MIDSLQSNNTSLERLHQNALVHLRKCAVNEHALSPIESMPGDILVTPRSRSPIQYVLDDCLRHPHPNRLDTLNALTSSTPGYNGIHTTVFTQQPCIDEPDADDICTYHDFSSDDSNKISSVIHFDKRQGTLHADGTMTGPWHTVEHEGRHGIDFQKNFIAERTGNEPQNLYTPDLLQENQAERNGIESENFLDQRFKLPLRTTYDEGAVYIVDRFTDILPSNPNVLRMLFEVSARLTKINDQLLARASHLTGEVEDPEISAFRQQQREILHEVREDLAATPVG